MPAGIFLGAFFSVLFPAAAALLLLLLLVLVLLVLLLLAAARSPVAKCYLNFVLSIPDSVFSSGLRVFSATPTLPSQNTSVTLLFTL